MCAVHEKQNESTASRNRNAAPPNPAWRHSSFGVWTQTYKYLNLLQLHFQELRATYEGKRKVWANNDRIDKQFGQI